MMEVVIIIDIIGFQIVFALQSQDFMNRIKNINIDLKNKIDSGKLKEEKLQPAYSYRP